MRKVWGLLGAAMLFNLPAITAQTQRPVITGIERVVLFAKDPAASEAFYVGVLHAKKVTSGGDPRVARYYFNSRQYVETLPLPVGAGDSRLSEVDFATTDLEALRTLLESKKVAQLTGISHASSHAARFTVSDPEGNTIGFDQIAGSTPLQCFSDVSCHLIHAGIMVHSRAAEDRFYVDTLGFRPYWQGAMQDGKVDWVSEQVPDGHEWLEYMLTGPESDRTPGAPVSPQELGVMNHIALAVNNMETTVTMLLKEYRLTGHYTGPNMGRDGKWQTNLYDPDGTRIELMEAVPTMEPCCSAYRADHPGLKP